MCGICGFADFQGRYSCEYRSELLQIMNGQIIHRGPDSEGYYTGEWLNLGMRRLSIIDVDTGDQPIYSSSGAVVLVFNGEIYNYIELKQTLTEKGYLFKTSSDTEVIANLFEEYGEKCFELLDGMFAIALLDIHSDSLYLVRDRMGEKPLYYYADNEKLLFGSELKCLRSTGLIPCELDTAALNLLFQYTYIPSPFSIYRDVRKLLPGHFLRVRRDGKLCNECYWHLERNEEYASISYEDAKAELRRRVDHAVMTRMRSDVPFGAFLSGGLDSGLIVALMAQHSDKPINTFTIGLNTAGDESHRAQKMAEHVGTNHTCFVLDYKDSIDAVSDIVSKMDEPFADSSCIPEYMVSRLASKHVKTVLTGDAGDELFLGYNKYLVDYYSENYMRFPRFIRKGLFEPAYRMLPKTSSLVLMAGKVLQVAEQGAFERRNGMMQLGFKDEECRALFREGFCDPSGQELISSYYYASTGGSMDRAQYLDLHIVLEGDMLTKVDRMSMLNSLETRTPFLANDLVEFAFSLPTSYKLQGKNKKRILKDTFKDLFPEGYDKLPKSGFGVPIREWFRNEMKEEIYDLLSENKIRTQGLFNSGYVKQILDEHISGKVDRKSEIWCLYVFQKWIEGKT